MKTQRRFVIAAAVVVVLASVVSVPIEAQCPSSPCVPARYKPGVQGGYVAVLGPGFDSTHRVLAQTGADYWANAMADRAGPPSIDVQSSGSGQIEIVLDDNLPSYVAGEDRTDGLGRGQVAINTRHLSNYAFLEHLFAHEFGHTFGFDNVSCGAGDTKMAAGVASDGPFTGAVVTCADKAGVDRDYRRDESPILIDLNSDGIELSDAEGGVCFTFGEALAPRKMAWPLSGDDAFLFLDRNGNGIVDHAGELFGNWTLLSTGVLADHGYQALGELDANSDGWITRDDPVFVNLRVWQDTGRDGVSMREELPSLGSTGVTALSVDARESRKKDRWGNEFRFRAKVQGASLHRFSYDVFLKSDLCR